MPKQNSPAVMSLGIVKQYLNGAFTALDNIALEIKENQIVSFIGPSGCGKTTMLRLISGLEYPRVARSRRPARQPLQQLLDRPPRTVAFE